MRGATAAERSFPTAVLYFNPHSPCGERLTVSGCAAPSARFQSTLPMRGATYRCNCSQRLFCNFNPHSPCGERQQSRKRQLPFLRFQSTLPMRGATCYRLFRCSRQIISIHTPHAGSDVRALYNAAGLTVISIHTPHAGSDPDQQKMERYKLDFNPHSPCGERHGLRPCS